MGEPLRRIATYLPGATMIIIFAVNQSVYFCSNHSSDNVTAEIGYFMMWLIELFMVVIVTDIWQPTLRNIATYSKELLCKK